MAIVVNKDELPGSSTSRQFEGYLHGDAHVSFFLSETLPGRGPSLHKHAYEEIFIVQAGRVTFTVGYATIEAIDGQIVIAPSDTPHKFINSGTETARHVDIHVNARMFTTWLED